MEAFKFPIALQASAMRLYHRVAAAGYELYVVGGFVRDQLLGRRGGDIDFATSATPQELKQLFPAALPTGIAHGTLTLLVDGDAYEVTTYRTEGTYHDARRPSEVFFTRRLIEDLKRRDFTINAFAYHPETKEVLDAFNGRADLQARCIRTIGNAQERFTEDALRMMRACRFVAQLDATLTTACLQAMQAMAGQLKRIAVERIRDELSKLLSGQNAVAGMRALNVSGLLQEFLPELTTLQGVSQNAFHAYDVYEHTLAVLAAVTDYQHKLAAEHELRQALELPLAALFHDVAKPQTRKVLPETGQATFFQHDVKGAEQTAQILRRLRFASKLSARVTRLVREHMLYSTDNWNDATIRRWLRRVGLANVSLLLALVRADRKGRGMTSHLAVTRTLQREETELLRFEARVAAAIEQAAALHVKDLAVDGRLLIKTFKLEPSPLIGKLLRHLLEMVLETPALNTRVQLVRAAGAFLQRSR